jgi:hypothetical protein
MCRWSVGARGDCCRHAELLGQLIDLALVQMRDRLHVGESITTLDEKPLIVFQPIRCANNGVMQAIGVIVLEHRSHALLEVRCRDDLSVLGRWNSYPALLAARRLDNEVRDVDTVRVESIGRQHELGAPIVFELRDNPTDGIIAPSITSRSLENRRDIFGSVFDPELIRE